MSVIHTSRNVEKDYLKETTTHSYNNNNGPISARDIS